MSDQPPPGFQRGPGWGPPWRRSGPPPWWPEGETWPPAGGQPWRRMGRRFMWRIAWFVAVAFLLIAVVLFAAIALVGTAAGVVPAHPGVRFISIAALLLLILVIVRQFGRFQRVALDVSELINAAGRIEAGEYGVKVSERGPRVVRTLGRAFNQMSARLATTDRNRRTFVADLTHELRTPLAVIRGQAEAIGDGVYPPDAAHIQPILDATQSLETLVEALGTMTLADVGSLRLHREPVEVAVLINSTLTAVQPMADSAGVKLESAVASGTPAINADPARVRGVLMNLLSNALRYTPSGGTITVGAQPSGDAVAISVRDTGPGIPPELRSRVFERFVKGPGSPGAGLGLAISKDIVTAHGGTIDVVSEVGKGTEVRFTLPVAR
jgi:two-component system sensor histidine kinase BaeS